MPAGAAAGRETLPGYGIVPGDLTALADVAFAPYAMLTGGDLSCTTRADGGGGIVLVVVAAASGLGPGALVLASPDANLPPSCAELLRTAPAQSHGAPSAPAVSTLAHNAWVVVGYADGELTLRPATLQEVFTSANVALSWRASGCGDDGSAATVLNAPGGAVAGVGADDDAGGGDDADAAAVGADGGATPAVRRRRLPATAPTSIAAAGPSWAATAAAPPLAVLHGTGGNASVALGVAAAAIATHVTQFDFNFSTAGCCTLLSWRERVVRNVSVVATATVVGAGGLRGRVSPAQHTTALPGTAAPPPPSPDFTLTVGAWQLAVTLGGALAAAVDTDAGLVGSIDWGLAWAGTVEDEIAWDAAAGAFTRPLPIVTTTALAISAPSFAASSPAAPALPGAVAIFDAGCRGAGSLCANLTLSPTFTATVLDAVTWTTGPLVQARSVMRAVRPTPGSRSDRGGLVVSNWAPSHRPPPALRNGQVVAWPDTRAPSLPAFTPQPVQAHLEVVDASGQGASGTDIWWTVAARVSSGGATLDPVDFRGTTQVRLLPVRASCREAIQRRRDAPRTPTPLYHHRFPHADNQPRLPGARLCKRDSRAAGKCCRHVPVRCGGVGRLHVRGQRSPLCVRGHHVGGARRRAVRDARNCGGRDVAAAAGGDPRLRVRLRVRRRHRRRVCVEQPPSARGRRARASQGRPRLQGRRAARWDEQGGEGRRRVGQASADRCGRAAACGLRRRRLGLQPHRRIGHDERRGVNGVARGRRPRRPRAGPRSDDPKRRGGGRSNAAWRRPEQPIVPGGAAAAPA